jgi:hypothetical protein
VVVVDMALAAACLGAMVAMSAAVPVDAAVLAARKPVTGLRVEAVASPDPVVMAPVLAVGSVAASEPPVAEPVWEARAPPPGEEPVAVLEEPLGWVEALPPVPVMVAPPAAEEPPDPVVVVVVAPPLLWLLVLAVDEVEPADPVEPPEPPVAPTELMALWLLSVLACVSEGVVSAWASPVPLARAAPKPSVTAPAPSQLDVSIWHW